MLAYVTGEGDFGQLYVRSLDSLEPRPIAGAERARAPFFSPDGKWIGFESGNQLVKAPVEGGKAWVISDAANFTGAVWTQRGIIFGSPLRIVSPEGGEPEMLHSPQVTSEAAWLAWPQLLPDGRSLMFTTVDAAGYGAAIELFDLDTQEVRRLIANGGNARYLSTGQIAYALDGSLMVVPFDLERREVTGRPVAAFDGLLMGFPWAPAMAHFAASGDGTLVYVAGPVIAVGSQLLRVERDGTTIAVGDPQRTIRGPSFSPDGEKIVVSAEVGGNPSQVWIHDLRRGTFTRLTPDEAWWPEWTPDGRRIVFTGVDVGDSTAQLFRMPADGSAGPERLTTSSLAQQVSSFSSDGRTMILHEVDLAGTKWDVLGMDLASPGAVPQPLLNDPYFELLAELSPDGRWLAYASNESGRYEVYVRSYPELDRKWQISADGGFEPVWSRDGTELFYRDEEGRRLISVDVAFEPEFKVGGTEVVLDQPFVPSVGFGRNYDVAPDGRSFLFVRQDLGEVERARLQVVLNWDDEVAAILSDETP